MIDEETFCVAVLFDLEQAPDDIDPCLSDEPERWRQVLGGLLEETMADITVKNAEVTQCGNMREGLPKLVRLRNERAALVERQAAIQTRARYAKALLAAVARERAVSKPARPVASFDGSETEQIRAYLREVFRLLEVIEGRGTLVTESE